MQVMDEMVKDVNSQILRSGGTCQGILTRYRM